MHVLGVDRGSFTLVGLDAVGRQGLDGAGVLGFLDARATVAAHPTAGIADLDAGGIARQCARLGQGGGRGEQGVGRQQKHRQGGSAHGRLLRHRVSAA
jgi:hypothetical protein